jgi:hypothetical protein
MSPNRPATGPKPMEDRSQRNIRVDRQEFATPAGFVPPVPANALGKRLFWSQDQFRSSC